MDPDSTPDGDAVVLAAKLTVMLVYIAELLVEGVVSVKPEEAELVILNFPEPFEDGIGIPDE